MPGKNKMHYTPKDRNPVGSRLRYQKILAAARRCVALIVILSAGITVDDSQAQESLELNVPRLQALVVGRSPADDDARLDSPRLRALADQLESGNAAALDEFWQEMEAATTPLIEPIPDDPNHVWLTPLWRGDAETKNVLLVGGLVPGDPLKDALAQLSTTDVWFRTYRTRTDLRASYRFSPNDPLIIVAMDDRKAVRALQKNYRRDPLNPNRYRAASLIELSEAPSQDWIEENPEATKGEVKVEKNFRSEILNNSRSLSVYLPPGYDPDATPYPMLLAFDRLAYSSLVPTHRILNHLIHAGRIPPVVAVLVGNSAGARNDELTCNEMFARFLATELMPWVRKNYNVSTNPEQNVIGGSSFGGLAASHFAFLHPEMFGNVISQSGSYWWSPDTNTNFLAHGVEGEWLTRQFAEAETKPIRFFQEVGLNEGGAPSMVIVNRHFRDVLLAKGYEIVRYDEFTGGHEYLNWRGSLAEALIALMGE
jgi:enterochelin esterase-like enzyme